MRKPVRVLVADDSPTVCAALSALLEEDPALEVVGTARDGVEAVALAKRLRPDVVTMDVRMPKLDGLEATAAIMASAPARILVVCSLSEKEQQELSFRAMAVGALEVLAKPVSTGATALRDWGMRVREAVLLMAEVPVITRRRTFDAGHLRFGSRGRIDAMGIAASTGGPPALATILSALPASLPVPVLIAQHMAEGFVSGLVRWLGTLSQMPIELAKTGMPLQAGRVYLPPDGHDLEVAENGIAAVSPSQGGHCPSADRLLSSMAEVFGARAGGLVLTGMGDDGTEGLLAIYRAGGATLTQDEATSVVYGMPRAAWEARASEIQVPLHAAASAIRALCEDRTTRTGTG